MKVSQSAKKIEKSGSLKKGLQVQMCGCARLDTHTNNGVKHRVDCELKTQKPATKKEISNLGEIYKTCCDETGGRFLAVIAQRLNDRRILAFEID